jgi:hypothetical protein
MGDGAVAIAVDVELQRLELQQPRPGLIQKPQHSEIRVAGEGAEASEFRQFDGDFIGPPQVGIVEAEQLGLVDRPLADVGGTGAFRGAGHGGAQTRDMGIRPYRRPRAA